MTERETSETDGPSRRSFMKQGALASGAVAVGAAGHENVLAEREENVEATQPTNALVFSYEFFPGAPFRVTSQLQASSTIDILNGPDDQGVTEISQPDEYNGYVISYRLGQSSIYTYVFTRGSTLQEDAQYTFGRGSQVFSSDLNLLQAQVSRGTRR